MNSGVEESNKDDISQKVEDVFATEYFLMKYILMIIPIYLSCLFFFFLDGSVLGMLKLLSGYTVVFSMFILSSEDMYILIKENIFRLFRVLSLTVIITLFCIIIMRFSDLLIIESSYTLQSQFYVNFNQLEIIIEIGSKFILSGFMILVTFWINISILALLVRFNVAHKALQFLNSK